MKIYKSYLIVLTFIISFVFVVQLYPNPIEANPVFESTVHLRSGKSLKGYSLVNITPVKVVLKDDNGKLHYLNKRAIKKITRERKMTLDSEEELASSQVQESGKDIYKSLSKKERKYYQKFSPQEKKLVNEISDTKERRAYATLNSKERKVFSQLSAKDRKYVSRLDVVQRKAFVNFNNKDRKNFKKIDEEYRIYFISLSPKERESFVKFAKRERDFFLDLRPKEKSAYLKMSSNEKENFSNVDKSNRKYFYNLSAEDRKSFAKLNQKEAVLFQTTLPSKRSQFLKLNPKERDYLDKLFPKYHSTYVGLRPLERKVFKSLEPESHKYVSSLKPEEYKSFTKLPLAGKKKFLVFNESERKAFLKYPDKYIFNLDDDESKFFLRLSPASKSIFKEIEDKEQRSYLGKLKPEEHKTFSKMGDEKRGFFIKLKPKTYRKYSEGLNLEMKGKFNSPDLAHLGRKQRIKKIEQDFYDKYKDFALEQEDNEKFFQQLNGIHPKQGLKYQQGLKKELKVKLNSKELAHLNPVERRVVIEKGYKNKFQFSIDNIQKAYVANLPSEAYKDYKSQMDDALYYETYSKDLSHINKTKRQEFIKKRQHFRYCGWRSFIFPGSGQFCAGYNKTAWTFLYSSVLSIIAYSYTAQQHTAKVAEKDSVNEEILNIESDASMGAVGADNNRILQLYDERRTLTRDINILQGVNVSSAITFITLYTISVLDTWRHYPQIPEELSTSFPRGDTDIGNALQVPQKEQEPEISFSFELSPSLEEQNVLRTSFSIGTNF